MPICDPARDGSSSSSSGSSCKRQSRDPTTGRGDSCTNMNINTTPRRQATPTTSLGSDRTGEGLPRLDKRERAVSRRALEGQRQQRAEQQQQLLLQRTTVPRSVKDRGDPRTNMSTESHPFPMWERRRMPCNHSSYTVMVLIEYVNRIYNQ